MPERKSVAAKPATGAKVTPVEPQPSETAGRTTVQDSNNGNIPEPLAQTGKNNLLPTIIVLSIVIGCVAIVSVGKKIN